MTKHVLNPPPHVTKLTSSDRTRPATPSEVVIPGRCSIHKSAFLMLARSEKDEWKIVGAVFASESLTSQTRASQLQDAVALEGSLVISPDYPGCPCCGDRGFIRCCGQFSCGGAVRAHEDHQDHLCGSCDTWRCWRGNKGIRNFQAYADASSAPARPTFAPELTVAESTAVSPTWPADRGDVD